MKKIVCVLCIFLASILLTGCWNYRGINRLDIVTGAAIDWNDQAGLFQVTFEIADVASASQRRNP